MLRKCGYFVRLFVKIITNSRQCVGLFCCFILRNVSAFTAEDMVNAAFIMDV